MRTDIEISSAEIRVTLRDWGAVEALVGEEPTVAVHVGGFVVPGDGPVGSIGPRVLGEAGVIRMDLSKAIELRDQLAAVIAEHQQMAAPAAV